jgi:hypothetical protein
MNTRQLVLAGCAVMILSLGSAQAGPCNTRDKDAGSGPTPGATGQSITTRSAETKAHPPTETMNKWQEAKPCHRRMLNSNSRVSPPQRSKPRVPSRQKTWRIKVAETFATRPPAFSGKRSSAVSDMNASPSGTLGP